MAVKKIKISCIHQGFELYGSDRMFIRCVSVIKKLYPSATITVYLPRHGSIVGPLEDIGCNIEYIKLFVLRKSTLISDIIFNSWRLMEGIRAARNIILESDLVYVNTSVIPEFYIASRLTRGRVVGHIHEIPQKIEMLAIKGMINFAKCSIIHNSAATKAAFNIEGDRDQYVLLNGTDDVAEAPPICITSGRRIRFLLIGRYNSWKGQDLLIEALAQLPANIRQSVEVRIVGSAFPGTSFCEQFQQLVRDRHVEDMVTMEEFVEEPAELFKWADVVIVPSRRPEPFGLVAIEAMAHGRPVLAAGHGGLLEILEGGVEGWFFRPNNVNDLCESILNIVRSPSQLSDLGERARVKFEKSFTSSVFEKNFAEIILKEIAKSA